MGTGSRMGIRPKKMPATTCSPAMLPKRRREWLRMRLSRPRISRGNMRGASHQMGPAKWAQ